MVAKKPGGRRQLLGINCAPIKAVGYRPAQPGDLDVTGSPLPPGTMAFIRIAGLPKLSNPDGTTAPDLTAGKPLPVWYLNNTAAWGKMIARGKTRAPGTVIIRDRVCFTTQKFSTPLYTIHRDRVYRGWKNSLLPTPIFYRTYYPDATHAEIVGMIEDYTAAIYAGDHRPAVPPGAYNLFLR